MFFRLYDHIHSESVAILHATRVQLITNAMMLIITNWEKILLRNYLVKINFDLTRDLCLTKDADQLLISRLKEKNLLSFSLQNQRKGILKIL